MLSDPEYLATFMARARTGALHPTVERMLFEYAFGKPQYIAEPEAPQETAEQHLRRAYEELQARRAAREAAEASNVVELHRRSMTDD